jgi:hypothetical protein
MIGCLLFFFVELYLGCAFQNYAPEEPLALGELGASPCDCRLTRSTLDSTLTFFVASALTVNTSKLALNGLRYNDGGYDGDSQLGTTSKLTFDGDSRT